MGIMTWKLKYFHISINGDLVGGTIDVLYPIMHTAKCIDVRGWFASDQFYPFFSVMTA